MSVTSNMMYADDTVIFFSVPLILEIELQINLELINLSEWLPTNKLILNLKKTHRVHGFWHLPETMLPRHQWGSYNVGRRICETL